MTQYDPESADLPPPDLDSLHTLCEAVERPGTGWSEFSRSSSGNVRLLSKRMGGLPLKATAGTSIVQAPPETCFRAYWDDKIKRKWDEHTADLVCLDKSEKGGDGDGKKGYVEEEEQRKEMQELVIIFLYTFPLHTLYIHPSLLIGSESIRFFLKKKKKK